MLRPLVTTVKLQRCCAVFPGPARASLSRNLGSHKSLIRAERFCSARMHWPHSSLVSNDTIMTIRHTKTILVALCIASASLAYGYYAWGSRLRLRDIATFLAGARPVGVLANDPLSSLGLRAQDVLPVAANGPVRYVGKSQYLNHARAVVTHTIDDSTRYIATCLDTMDKYGIKATVFVSTQAGAINELWPRLRQAIHNGHEIGSHSRRHQCQ